jgi:flagellar basal-body rod modification protein FlgD
MNAVDNNPLEAIGLSPPKVAPKGQLGQEDFLELMMAQLRNQDPFEPLHSGEFLGQIAQFGTVSGIQQMQESIKQLSESLHSNQALQAAALVGRRVLSAADTAVLNDGGEVAGAVELPVSSGAVAIGIYDMSGNLVRRIELGTQGSGLAHFSWDGMSDAGSRAVAGEYLVRAEANVDGEIVAQSTLISSQVNSVTLGGIGGTLVLNLADGNSLEFADVQQIM